MSGYTPKCKTRFKLLLNDSIKNFLNIQISFRTITLQIS